MINEDFHRELKESLYLKLTETMHRFLGGLSDEDHVVDADDVWKVYIKRDTIANGIFIYISIPELQYTILHRIPPHVFFEMDHENDIDTLIRSIVNASYEEDLMEYFFL